MVCCEGAFPLCIISQPLYFCSIPCRSRKLLKTVASPQKSFYLFLLPLQLQRNARVLCSAIMLTLIYHPTSFPFVKCTKYDFTLIKLFDSWYRRTVAWGTPRLWTSVSFPISRSSKSHATLYDAIREWLGRAGALLLEMRIACSSEPSITPQPLLNVMKAYAARCHHLEVLSIHPFIPLIWSHTVPTLFNGVVYGVHLPSKPNGTRWKACGCAVVSGFQWTTSFAYYMRLRGSESLIARCAWIPFTTTT